MRWTTVVLTVGLTSLAPHASSAQRTLEVDLGASGGGRRTQSIGPGVYGVLIVNLIPDTLYNVSVLVRTVRIEPLPDPGAGEAGFAPGCAKTDSARKALAEAGTALSEEKVKVAVAALRSAVASEPAGCTEGVAALIQSTVFEWPTNVVLEQGEEVEIAVVRLKEGKPDRTWTQIFTTGPVGEWRVSYGFAVPFGGWGKSGAFARGDRPALARFAKDSFIVIDRSAKKGTDAVPILLYHFMRSAGEGKPWARSLTAGLGADIKEPVVLLSHAWTYYQNLTLHGGVLTRRERRLLARYAPGDTVTADLSADQLTEPAFFVRPFVAVTLRFGANPFASNGPKKGSETPKAAAPTAESEKTRTPPRAQPSR